MSAWDVAGAVVWTPLALLFLGASLTPSDPPHPPYGPRETGAFVWSVTFGIGAVYCIARCCGAHA